MEWWAEACRQAPDILTTLGLFTLDDACASENGQTWAERPSIRVQIWGSLRVLDRVDQAHLKTTHQARKQMEVETLVTPSACRVQTLAHPSAEGPGQRGSAVVAGRPSGNSEGARLARGGWGVRTSGPNDRRSPVHGRPDPGVVHVSWWSLSGSS